MKGLFLRNKKPPLLPQSRLPLTRVPSSDTQENITSRINVAKDHMHVALHDQWGYLTFDQEAAPTRAMKNNRENAYNIANMVMMDVPCGPELRVLDRQIPVMTKFTSPTRMVQLGGINDPMNEELKLRADRLQNVGATIGIMGVNIGGSNIPAAIAEAKREISREDLKRIVLRGNVRAEIIEEKTDGDARRYLDMILEERWTRIDYVMVGSFEKDGQDGSVALYKWEPLDCGWCLKLKAVLSGVPIWLTISEIKEDFVSCVRTADKPSDQYNISTRSLDCIYFTNIHSAVKGQVDDSIMTDDEQLRWIGAGCWKSLLYPQQNIGADTQRTFLQATVPQLLLLSASNRRQFWNMEFFTVRYRNMLLPNTHYLRSTNLVGNMKIGRTCQQLGATTSYATLRFSYKWPPNNIFVLWG